MGNKHFIFSLVYLLILFILPTVKRKLEVCEAYSVLNRWAVSGFRIF